MQKINDKDFVFQGWMFERRYWVVWGVQEGWPPLARITILFDWSIRFLVWVFVREMVRSMVEITSGTLSTYIVKLLGFKILGTRESYAERCQRATIGSSG